MTTAEVILWGKTVGAVTVEDASSPAFFQYDPGFAQSGIEVSPLMMPLSRRVYSFPGLPRATFHGLPGFLADSIPDKFGNALIDAWLAQQGRSADSFNAVERLCYTGSRGTGALEFRPVTGPQSRVPQRIDVDALVQLASSVLSDRKSFKSLMKDGSFAQPLKEILRIGTSAGGARAKAVIAWNPFTGEVRSGQVKADEGFEYWLLKFDGVRENRDRELADPKGYGAVEYAYSLMAKKAGIRMSECRLLEENGRRHFMTKRFDRLPDGRKLHMQSLCALAHYDFNMPGAYSYEQLFAVMRSLDLPAPSFEEQFRRMAFNIIARNNDDHAKNIAFLMDKSGAWSLSPAFDITYSYNPGGAWTSSHQMTMNGKRGNFSMDDFNDCGKTIMLKRGRAKAIAGEVHDAVRQWSDFADAAGVDSEWKKRIGSNLCLDIVK